MQVLQSTVAHSWDRTHLVNRDDCPRPGLLCAGLGFPGIKLKERRNAATKDVISAASSRVTVRLIRTKEELIIAKKMGPVLDLAGIRRNWRRLIESLPIVCPKFIPLWYATFRLEEVPADAERTKRTHEETPSAEKDDSRRSGSQEHERWEWARARPSDS